MICLRLAAAVLLTLLLAGPASAVASQQPPAPATQEYVPVDTVEEQLPAAPLLIGAYSVVWIALVIYVWSIWQRLTRVEREIAQVTRRIQAGGSR